MITRSKSTTASLGNFAHNWELRVITHLLVTLKQGRSQNFELRESTLLLIVCSSFNFWLCYYLATKVFFFFLWVRTKLFLFIIFYRAGLFILDKISWLCLFFFFLVLLLVIFVVELNFFGHVYFVLDFRSIHFFYGH